MVGQKFNAFRPILCVVVAEKGEVHVNLFVYSIHSNVLHSFYSNIYNILQPNILQSNILQPSLIL